MPSKKKKYNARFPAGRIKKIMQSDEDIGKVAQAVPVIISRTLELFVESLLTKTLRITNSRNAKTLSTSHMKQCIMSEQRFDFLRELVKNVPDISVAEEAANYNEEDGQSSPDDVYPDSDTPYDLSMPSTSGGRNQYRTTTPGQPKVNGGQTHFQYKQQQQQQQYQLTPHNGSTIDTAAIEADLRQRLRQRLNNTRSVIVHTASVAQAAAAAARPPPASPATATPAATTTPARGAYGNYVQPIKLMRSESSPANAAQHLWQVSSNSATQKQAGQKRLRHQALSVPCNNNNDNCTGASPAKRQKPDSITQQTHSQTAIPAPVFSYDLCNKPVVKIDYSNLPLTPATLGASEQPHTTPSMSNLPLSAPVTNANFNFSAAAPIINIDLSNIVTNSGGGGDSKLLSAGNKPPVPAVATISIGALPVEMASAVASPPASGVCSNIGAVVKSPPTSSTPPTNQLSDCKIDGNAAAGESTSSASSSCCSPSSSSLASTSANSLQGGGSKSMLKASSEIMAKMTAAGTKTLAATCKSSNTLLELDEDYDNI